MARINNKTSQTLSIGRAVIAIVVLLGVFQIGWVTRLLAASWQHYQQAVENTTPGEAQTRLAPLSHWVRSRM